MKISHEASAPEGHADIGVLHIPIPLESQKLHAKRGQKGIKSAFSLPRGKELPRTMGSWRRFCLLLPLLAKVGRAGARNIPLKKRRPTRKVTLRRKPLSLLTESHPWSTSKRHLPLYRSNFSIHRMTPWVMVATPATVKTKATTFISDSSSFFVEPILPQEVSEKSDSKKPSGAT